jgi:hypothetical protein
VSPEPVQVGSRTVHVDARRLERWVAGFGERHGAVTTEVVDGAVVLSGADGALASLAVPYPPLDLAGAADPVAALVAHALAGRRVAVLLVRRGGYAVALVAGGTVAASKVGSRYVQGRTAAGGWSQQRFARRREGQTAGLLDAAAATAVRVLAGPAPDVVVTGGDRTLADRLLADPRLRDLARLPRERHLDVGDPRAADVAALPERLRGVRITLTP